MLAIKILDLDKAMTAQERLINEYPTQNNTTARQQAPARLHTLQARYEPSVPHGHSPKWEVASLEAALGACIPDSVRRTTNNVREVRHAGDNKAVIGDVPEYAFNVGDKVTNLKES